MPCSAEQLIKGKILLLYEGSSWSCRPLIKLKAAAPLMMHYGGPVPAGNALRWPFICRWEEYMLVNWMQGLIYALEQGSYMCLLARIGAPRVVSHWKAFRSQGNVSEDEAADAAHGIPCSRWNVLLSTVAKLSAILRFKRNVSRGVIVTWSVRTKSHLNLIFIHTVQCYIIVFKLKSINN